MKPTARRTWIGLAVFLGLLSVWGVHVYRNRLVPHHGFMVPNIPLKEQRERRNTFTLYQSAFWTGALIAEQCGTSDFLKHRYAIMGPLLAEWARRYYLYTVHLRYGHMPRVKALRDFERMTEADWMRVKGIVTEKIRKEGGCGSKFVKDMETYVTYQLNPTRLAELVPEYNPERLNTYLSAHANLLSAQLHLVDAERCVPTVDLAQVQSSLDSNIKTAKNKFIEALPLDTVWATEHFETLAKDRLATRLADREHIRHMLGVESPCKKADNPPAAH